MNNGVHDMESSLPLKVNREELRLAKVQIKRAGGKLALLHIDAVFCRDGWICPVCFHFHPADEHVIPGMDRCRNCRCYCLILCCLGGEAGLQYFTVPLPE